MLIITNELYSNKVLECPIHFKRRSVFMKKSLVVNGGSLSLNRDMICPPL